MEALKQDKIDLAAIRDVQKNRIDVSSRFNLNSKCRTVDTIKILVN